MASAMHLNSMKNQILFTGANSFVLCTMGLIHKCETIFKFFISSMTHVCKLEARTNHKFHADKSFGGARRIF